MHISAIVAMDRNRLIGNDGTFPWERIPADMRHFKRKTTPRENAWENIVVMGRRTFESEPIGSRPFKNRTNIVLSRTLTPVENVIVTRSVNDVFYIIEGVGRCMIIGGAEMYRLFAPHIQTLYVTVVEDEFSGDTYFPMDAFPSITSWDVAEYARRNADKDTAGYNLTFKTLKRRCV